MRDKVKNISLILVLIIAGISLPIGIIGFMREPIINNYYTENYYGDNETQPDLEPEPIIDRSKPVEFYNISFNKFHDYFTKTYEIGTNERYEHMRVGTAYSIQMEFIPAEWAEAFLDSFNAPERYPINDIEDVWVPPYLWNWTLIIWTSSAEPINIVLYYDAIRTVFN